MGAAYEETEARKKWQRQALAEHGEASGRNAQRRRTRGGDIRRPCNAQLALANLGEGFLVTVSLINSAVSPDPDKIDPCLCLYQIGFECTPVGGEILEYPRIEAVTRDKEEEELRVLYRRIRTFAVGHGCAAEWKDEYARTADAVRTQLLPFYEVAAVGTGDDASSRPGKSVGLPTPRSRARPSLQSLAVRGEYNDWIEGLLEENDDIPASYEEPVTRILERVRAAARPYGSRDQAP